MKSSAWWICYPPLGNRRINNNKKKHFEFSYIKKKCLAKLKRLLKISHNSFNGLLEMLH
jgi:hypothetical protein